MMFHWEPEGRYCHRLCTVIAPFWFSTEHRWIVIMPFWLSTDYIRHCVIIYDDEKKSKWLFHLFLFQLNMTYIKYWHIHKLGITFQQCRKYTGAPGKLAPKFKEPSKSQRGHHFPHMGFNINHINIVKVDLNAAPKIRFHNFSFTLCWAP